MMFAARRGRVDADGGDEAGIGDAERKVDLQTRLYAGFFYEFGIGSLTKDAFRDRR